MRSWDLLHEFSTAPINCSSRAGVAGMRIAPEARACGGTNEIGAGVRQTAAAATPCCRRETRRRYSAASFGGHAEMRSSLGRRGIVAFALALLSFGFAGHAAAHALLVEAIPAEAASLDASPPQLVLRFNSRIEHKLSRAALLLGENGDPQPLTLDVDAPPDRLIAALPPALAPGSYVVDWQVLSVDGHRVAGRLHFQVRGPG
jgi:methionine-rich copper-binding protein CopC